MSLPEKNSWLQPIFEHSATTCAFLQFCFQELNTELLQYYIGFFLDGSESQHPKMIAQN